MMNLVAELISENDIIHLFMNGLSIKMLTNKVAATERITKEKSRSKVERAIYSYLKKCNEF